MHFRQISIVVAVLLLTVILSGPALAGADTGVTLSENETVSLQDPDTVTVDGELSTESGETRLIVSFSDTPNQASVAELQAHADQSQADLLRFANQTAGLSVEKQFWISNEALVTIDNDEITLDSLAQIEGVTRLEENAQVTAAGSATSGQHASQSGALAAPETTASQTTYGLDQINAPAVWDEYNTRGDGVRVAVLDTGLALDHPDLDLYTSDSSDPTYPGGWAEFDAEGNQVDGSVPQEFGDFHGTHVSGTVAGGSSGEMAIGVAPDAELMHGAVLTDCSDRCSGTGAQVLAGMQWAVENNADVVSMSLSSGSYTDGYIDAVRNVEANGVTVVAATGNSGPGTSGSPGNVYDALGVGASNENRDIWSDSSGEEIITDDAWSNPPSDWPDQYVVPAVTAPGEGVYSAIPDGSWGYATGTSMATPHVAGSVALIQSATNDNHSPDEITQALEATAWKPTDSDVPPGERDTRYGSGIVDVPAAISYLNGETPEPDLSVTSASLDETTIFEGDSAVTTATVSNDGDARGTFTAGLRVDGTVVDITSVAVQAGETETVTFERTFTRAGDYAIAVNGTSAGTLTVEQPATFETRDVSLEETALIAGESAVATATVENVGDQQGTHTVGLGVDGETVETQDVTLAPGETETVTFERQFTRPGEYAITVDAVDAGTLTVEQSSAFEIQDVALGETTILEGEQATVTATIENTGDQDDTHWAALYVDGEIVETEAVDIAAGGTETVTFEQSFPDSGDYLIAVDGVDAGTLTVDQPATFEAQDVSLAETSIGQGDAAVVSATIENVGDREGSHTVGLSVDGEVVETSAVTLTAGGTETVTFERTFSELGAYTIAVDGVFAGTLIVERPASIETRNATLAESTITEDRQAVVNATVENVGGLAGNRTLSLSVDGETVQTREVRVASGETEIVSFERMFTRPGEYAIAVDGIDAGTLTVEESVFLTVSDVRLNETTISTGEQVGVNATVENSGFSDEIYPVSLEVDGEIVDTLELSIGSGETETVTFERTFAESGEYAIAANGVDAGTLTVEGTGSDSPLDTYRNEDGEVTTDRLRDSIADWRSGEINTDLLRDVIREWRNRG